MRTSSLVFPSGSCACRRGYCGRLQFEQRTKSQSPAKCHFRHRWGSIEFDWGANKTSWAYYQIPWSQLMQGGWGTAASFSAASILYLEFEIGACPSFDLYIDDLGFY